MPLFSTFGFKSLFKHHPEVPDSDVTPEYLVDYNWLVGSPKTVTEKLGKMYQDTGGFGCLLVLTFVLEIPPILQAIAWFGLGQLPSPTDGDDVPPLTGFLAGILMAFDPGRVGSVDATYQAVVDTSCGSFSRRSCRRS